MKVSNILSYATFSLVLVFSTTLFAANASSGNKIAKLPTMIKINPADVDMTTILINANMEKARTAGKNISSASVDMVNLLSKMEQDLSSYQNKVNECKNKNYTTEDQKNAHCTDDMTVAQCSQSLFKMCIWKESSAVTQDTDTMLVLINNRLKNNTNDLEQSVRYINTHNK
jgi:hypothetical protein